jgi:pilus assembly protein CpaB
MKAKAIIPLVLGLCIGLVAVKLGVDAVKSAKAANKDKETVQAIRAVQDINVGVELTFEMVDLVETVPNAFLPAKDRATELEDVVGRVTAKPIPQGAPVLYSLLAPEGTSPGMPGLIKPGFRAVSVKIDEVSGVAYQIKPGDWVDVIVVMDIAGERSKKETIAEVILQHVRVVAVGRSLTRQASEDSTKTKSAKSATLMVPEEDVPKLHLAGTRGKLTFALRGDDDLTSPAGAFARLEELLGATKEPEKKAEPAQTTAPVKQGPVQVAMATPSTPEPDPPHSIAIYRGMPDSSGFEVEHITFEDAGSRIVVDGGEGPKRGASSLLRSRQGTRQPARGNARPRQDRVDVPDVDDETGFDEDKWETE